MLLGDPFKGVKADIFSLGATLFNLLLGTVLFNIRFDESKTTRKEKKEVSCEDKFYKLIMENKIDVFWKAVEAEYNNPVISPEFKNLIIRMVAFKEEDRPKNIQEILDDAWFKEINNLSEEEEKKLKEEYISEMKKKEEKMKDTFCSTENVKQKIGNYRINESYCNISFRDDMIPRCVKEDLKFDNFIKIKGDLKPLSFMNNLLQKVLVLYDKIEIGEKEKNLKFKILFKVNDEDDESSIVLEKDLTILIELLKVNEKEYVLNFMKEEGELSNFYYYVKTIIGYAKEYI